MRAAVEKAEAGRAPGGQPAGERRPYGDNADSWKQWQKMGVLAVEMEAAALYMNAARRRRGPLYLHRVRTRWLRAKACSAEERQTSFTNMMDIAFGII